jgi:predicted DNA-binding helix-hairpin-helix protein
MIVGADAASDRDVLENSANLYSNYRLKRVYYSAFSPIPDASRALPLQPPPLVREHRLYQADWLLRFYEFDVDEIAPAGDAGMLALDVDPKLAWALRNRARFPVRLQTAARELMLRVPGLGVRNVDRLIGLRRVQCLRLTDLARLRVPLKKTLPFVELDDHRPRDADHESSALRARIAPPPRQADLFGAR